MSSTILFLFAALWLTSSIDAFSAPRCVNMVPSITTTATRSLLVLSSSDNSNDESTASGASAAATTRDPMQDAAIDSETYLAMERARRADELRAQEVFMQKSTGKHACTNCDWIYDETKGDAMMIGGQIKPGTAFADLPSNWRCPVCRASKDSFQEQVIEIPGFAVNQGYGFGTNSMTAGQKNLLIFGGLGFFFLLFLSGYALN